MKTHLLAQAEVEIGQKQMGVVAVCGAWFVDSHTNDLQHTTCKRCLARVNADKKRASRVDVSAVRLKWVTEKAKELVREIS